MTGKHLLIRASVISLLITVSFWTMAFLWNDTNNNQFIDSANKIDEKFNAFLKPIMENSQSIIDEGVVSQWLIDELNNNQTFDIRPYLDSKKEIIPCQAIDIASSYSDIVYQEEGTHLKMSPDNDRDIWYYNFQDSLEEQNFEFYYDSLQGILYLYHNVKIIDSADNNLGVLGFRILYNDITKILNSDKKGVEAYFTDDRGEIMIHSNQSKIGSYDIYDYYGLLQKDNIDQSTDISIKSTVNTSLVHRNSYGNFPGYLVVISESHSRSIYLLILSNILILIIFNMGYSKIKKKTYVEK